MWIVNIEDHYKAGDAYLGTAKVQPCPICGKLGVPCAGRYLHSFSMVERQPQRTPVEYCGSAMTAQPVNMQPVGEAVYA